MRQYPFPRTRLNSFLFGLFMTAMLYLSRDSLVTTSLLGFGNAQFLMLGLMVLAGLAFLIYNRRQWKSLVTDKRLVLLLIAVVLLLGPMLAKRDWQMMYFSVLLCLVFGIFLTFFTTTEQVSKYYVVILSVIGVYSVAATYLLRLLPDWGLVPVPVFFNQRGTEFYQFGISYVSRYYVPNRNFGIFREPGVYQYFVILGLLLNNYTVSWNQARNRWIVNCVLTVVMLSTFATGGYAELALLALVVFVDEKLYRNKKVCWTLAGIAVVVLAVLFYSWYDKNELYWELYGMVISKVFGQEASSTERMDSILLNLGCFLNNPSFGGRLTEVLHSIENNTSSTTLMLAIFGLGGGALHLAGWLALVWKKERKLWMNLALLAVMLVSFNTQNLIADVFLWLMPTMALTQRIGAYLERKKV